MVQEKTKKKKFSTLSKAFGVVRRKSSKAKDETIINLKAQLDQQERERERERERAKPKTLKIDPTPSTSTITWGNTPTPKTSGIFSFSHSREHTEETIYEEENYDSEDFITGSNSKNKGKQKQFKPELTSEVKNYENELDKDIEWAADLQNNFLKQNEQLQIALKAYGDLEAKLLNLTAERDEKENQRQAAIVAQTTAEADRDQIRQSLDHSLQRQITLTSRLIARGNQVCDLEAEKNDLETTAQTYYNYAEQKIKSNKHQYNNLLDEIGTAYDNITTQQQKLKDLQAQLEHQKNLNQDQKKEYLAQIRLKLETAKRVQEQLDNLEAQVAQLDYENQTLRNNSRRENSSIDIFFDPPPISPILSQFSLEFSDLSSPESQSNEEIPANENSDEETGERIIFKPALLTIFPEEDEQNENFNLGESSLTRENQLGETSNSVNFDQNNDFTQEDYGKISDYDLEAQENSTTEGYGKRLKKAINNQAKKAQNYLVKSYRNHPQTYQAIGLTALGAATAYYNWETLTEYLNPQQIQGALSSLSNYSGQAIAAVSSTALTCLPNFNLNNPNQVENNLNLNWTNQTSSFGPQCPALWTDAWEPQLGISLKPRSPLEGNSLLNGDFYCEGILTDLTDQNSNKNEPKTAEKTENVRPDTKVKKPKKCKNRSLLGKNLNTCSSAINLNPSLENSQETGPNFQSTHPKTSELATQNEVNQTLSEPVNNPSFSPSTESSSQVIVPVNSSTLTHWNTLKNSTNQNWPNLTAFGSNLQFPSYNWKPNNPLENWLIEWPFHHEEVLTNLTVEDNKTSLKPVNNQSLNIQWLNELWQKLISLGVPSHEIANVTDRKTLFKYHPDKAVINGLSPNKANEIFQNLTAYRDQLENITGITPNLLENSAYQPDNLLNETQINSSSNGNQTETSFEWNSILPNPNNLVKITLGGTVLIVSQKVARKLWARYKEKQQEQERQTREKAAIKIQSTVRRHQAQQEFQREKERLSQEEAARKAEHQRQEQSTYEEYGWYSENNSQNNSSPFTQPTNSPSSTETKTNNPEIPSQNHTSPSSETPTYSAPDGGDYSSGGTTIVANLTPQSPNQLVQDILNQAEKAIESQQIPPLEVSEKRITSLFAEPEASKYYQYQPQLENKLEKVIQTKTIQEIKVNHLDIAKQIKETIEPQKIKNKDWKDFINGLSIEKIPSHKKQIQSDILQQTKKAATESLESDLTLAQLIKWDIQPEKNWKLTLKNASSEKEIKQNWEENKQSLLTQSQEAVINNLNSLLGSELKITDLDEPFSEFSQEVYRKELTALAAYQQQVAAHIADKKRNYSQTAQLNTIRPESRLKNLILPLTVGGIGVTAGILVLKYWLNAPKMVNKINPPGSNPSTKIKLLIERYLTNLKKLQNNGYNMELAQTIQEDFQRIQTLMEECLSKQKNKFEEKNWQDFSNKYKRYSEG